jgi:cytochrome c553
MPNRTVLTRSLLVLTFAGIASAGLTPGRAGAAHEDVLARGRYIVQNVGMCVNCHGANLRGANLDFLAPGLPPAVARHAPRIAGLPQLTTAQAVHFFETGILPDGKTARPPMPQIRLHRDDAEAVAAYLKSLR